MSAKCQQTSKAREWKITSKIAAGAQIHTYQQILMQLASTWPKPQPCPNTSTYIQRELFDTCQTLWYCFSSKADCPPANLTSFNSDIRCCKAHSYVSVKLRYDFALLQVISAFLEINSGRALGQRAICQPIGHTWNFLVDILNAGYNGQAASPKGSNPGLLVWLERPTFALENQIFLHENEKAKLPTRKTTQCALFNAKVEERCTGHLQATPLCVLYLRVRGLRAISASQLAVQKMRLSSWR